MGALEDQHAEHLARRARLFPSASRPQPRASPPDAVRRSPPALPPRPKVRRAPVRSVAETTVPEWVRHAHRAGVGLTPGEIVLHVGDAAGVALAAVLSPRSPREEFLRDAACYWLAALTALDFAAVADWMRLPGGAEAARDAARRAAIRTRMPQVDDSEVGL